MNGLSTSLTALIEDAITDAVTTKAPSENAVFDALATKLNLVGGTMTGSLVMASSSTITGLPALPLAGSEATSKDYVDGQDTALSNGKLSKTGGTMSGVLTLDSDLKIKGGSNYVTIKGHATSDAYNFILPQTDGASGEILRTDGAGNLSWINPSTVAPGAATVDSSSIVDGTIVDADISASAAIAQSKISGLTTALSGKQTTALADGKILVGNGSGVAAAVAVSGDVTLSNTGAVTLVNTAVTPSTYNSVTVDAKGRVTGGTNEASVKTLSVSAPLANSGTASDPIIGMPVATTTDNGYLSSANWNTFNSKQDAITAATSLNTGSVTTNLQGGIVLNPYGVAAGNTGEIRFNELVGTNYVAFRAPDVLAANCYGSLYNLT